uniref:Anoctamin n=1 Tax=Timema shepardi TaxID=629360 RepID=A0A7R9AY58_TIMSH|nr:unnamed protein product [Timema shepardi]
MADRTRARWLNSAGEETGGQDSTPTPVVHTEILKGSTVSQDYTEYSPPGAVTKDHGDCGVRFATFSRDNGIRGRPTQFTVDMDDAFSCTGILSSWPSFPILQSSTTTQLVFKEPPKVAYKQPANLRNLLGTLEVSPVTGRLEPTYPAWKRNVFRYFVSVPIIFLCLLTVFVIMIYTLQLQEWWDTLLTERGYSFYLSYLPKILLAVVIALMDEAYYKVACWLNDRDLPDCTDSTCRWLDYTHARPIETIRPNKTTDQAILRAAPIQTTQNNNNPPWKEDRKFHLHGRLDARRIFPSLFLFLGCPPVIPSFRVLWPQLAALLIARQVIGNLKESALPYLLEQLRLAKLSFDLFGALSPTEAKKELPGNQQEDSGPGEEQNSIGAKPAGNRNVSQAELESTLFKYDGTFEDHLEIFIQLGYVVLFSSAFPMAAFCAFLNNLIEIRSDAFKLCFIFQRPFGQRVSSIGTWQNAMEVMGLIAVLVNCALIGLSGQVHRMFPEMSTTQTILLIVALEETSPSPYLYIFLEGILALSDPIQPQVTTAYNRGRLSVNVSVNDTVMCRTFPLSSAADRISAKLNPRWSGPWRISSFLTPVSVHLKLVEDEQQSRRSHSGRQSNGPISSDVVAIWLEGLRGGAAV